MNVAINTWFFAISFYVRFCALCPFSNSSEKFTDIANNIQCVWMRMLDTKEQTHAHAHRHNNSIQHELNETWNVVEVRCPPRPTNQPDISVDKQWTDFDGFRSCRCDKNEKGNKNGKAQRKCHGFNQGQHRDIYSIQRGVIRIELYDSRIWNKCWEYKCLSMRILTTDEWR